jgi:hypothetical protein
MDRRTTVGFYAAIGVAVALFALWLVTSDHAAITLSAQ